MTKTKLEEGIFNAFLDKGIVNPDFKIKITSREIIGNSDYAKVTVEIFPPKKRKPTIVWELAINIVRNTIHWDKSSFYRP